MADVEKFVEGLVDYSIVLSYEDADDLFEDISHLLAKKDFKSAGEVIYDYELEVYDYGEDELPYTAEGYASCLEEIYEDYPFTEEDLHIYHHNMIYNENLRDMLVKENVLKNPLLAEGAAKIISEDMQNAHVREAADLLENVSNLPRLQLVVKLGDIACRLKFDDNGDLD